jgi:archaellum biogenesis protein FlaJ (TadC family)
MNPTVFILIEHWDYEYDKILSVFAEKEQADIARELKESEARAKGDDHMEYFVTEHEVIRQP